MRVQTIVGVALVGGVTALSAQHGHQLEIGGFGTYNRYDPVYGMNRQFGGGGRLGFFLSNALGLELDGDMSSPFDSTGTIGTAITRASASLLLNSGGEHNILYVLGGYTRFRWGGYSPYFWLNEVHAGIGDRIFFGGHVALRLEARAFYAIDDWIPGKKPLDVTGSAGLSFLLGGRGGHEAEAPEIPKTKRDSILAAGGTVPTEKPSKKVFVEGVTNWPRQWFWGGQAGLLVFHTDYDGFSAEPTFGGHWLITAKKTALYVGYEQSFFLTDRHATIIEPSGAIEDGNVAFKSLRRIMMGVLAFPVQKAIQPYGGIGFAIVEVLNPEATCTGCTLSETAIVQEIADNAATKAFFWWMGGMDVRQGRLSLYGHYILTSSARGFLISGVTHTFQGGLRYSLGSASEDVTERH